MSVRGKGDGGHLGLLGEVQEFSCSASVPQRCHSACDASRDNAAAIRRKSGRADGMASLEDHQFFSARGFPDRNRPFPAGKCQDETVAVGGKNLPLVYDELRRLAAARLSHEKRGGELAYKLPGGHLRLVWDGETGKEVATLEGHTKGILVAFSGDGKRILSAGLDKTIRIWDAATAKAIAALPETDHVWYATFSPNRQRILVCTREEHLKKFTVKLLWTARRERPSIRCRNPGRFSSAVFSPDGQRLLTGAGRRQLCLPGRSVTGLG